MMTIKNLTSLITLFFIGLVVSSCNDDTLNEISSNIPEIKSQKNVSNPDTGWSSSVLIHKSDYAPSAAYVDNKIHLYFIGQSDDALKLTDSDSWTSVQHIGGLCSAAPSATYQGGNDVNVYVRGRDDSALWQTWSKDGGKTFYSAFKYLGGYLKSAPAAVSWAPARDDIFVQGSDNRVWHKYYQSGWHGFYQESQISKSVNTGLSAVSRQSNRIDLFFRTGNSDFLYYYWNGSSWSYKTITLSAKSKPGAVAVDANRLEVYYKSNSNTLRVAYKEGTNVHSNWTDIDIPGSYSISSEPTAVVDNSKVHVFFTRSTDNKIVHLWRNL